MDVLSGILSHMHISGSVLAKLQCGGTWGLDMEPGDGIAYHFITKGSCWLIAGGVPAGLAPGDLIVVSGWPLHALASSPGAGRIPITEVVLAHGHAAWRRGVPERPFVLRAGTNDDVHILSGVFSLEGRGAAMLLEQLPSILHLRAQEEGLAPQLRTALDFIRQESAIARPGYAAVATRLVDLLFIQILRAAIMQPTVTIGLLAGLADPRLGRALAAIHARPANPWSVASLAAEAGLSRTNFAELFRNTLATTPMNYVNRWRMMVAEDMLLQDTVSIDAVRHALGYNSSFTFARAFRAHHGQSPREYQRTVRTPRANDQA